MLSLPPAAALSVWTRTPRSTSRSDVLRRDATRVWPASARIRPQPPDTLKSERRPERVQWPPLVAWPQPFEVVRSKSSPATELPTGSATDVTSLLRENSDVLPCGSVAVDVR